MRSRLLLGVWSPTMKLNAEKPSSTKLPGVRLPPRSRDRLKHRPWASPLSGTRRGRAVDGPEQPAGVSQR